MRNADTNTPTVPKSVLRELCTAGVAELSAEGQSSGGFVLRVRYGASGRQLNKLLGTTRGGLRRFASLDSAAAFLRELDIDQFRVDVSDYEPSRVRSPRPDRLEALRKTRTTPAQTGLPLGAREKAAI